MILLCLLFFVLSLPFSSWALEVRERRQGYVSDDAGMISPEAKARLEARLRSFEEDTSNQVVVATFPSLEGEVLEDFSIRVAEKWKIGQASKDNGVILLIFKDDRKVRLEVGYGLEGALPDATAKLIIENEIVPRFREGKFDEGVEQGIQAIVQATKGEYRGEAPSETLTGVAGAVLLGTVLWGAFAPLMFLLITLGLAVLFATVTLAFGAYVVAVLAFLLGLAPLLAYFLLGRWGGRPVVLFDPGTRVRRTGGGGRNDWGGGSFGGGFSGGGGSFGGGGASGGW